MLLEVNDLKGVRSGNVNGAVVKCQGSKGTAELVDLGKKMVD